MSPALKLPKASGLYAYVSRGTQKGELLYPHRHDDDMYVVSPTRLEKDYIRVGNLADVPAWLAKGYRLRMSNRPAGVVGPRLIMPQSIFGR
ncbi:hypothetical protein [Mesorhizobium sp. M0500]|uniref:hypothetical protein n=1 Tax=Mesorhizobium sp. M0500 TaxID=2956953 RepID=UPI00333DD02B